MGDVQGSRDSSGKVEGRLDGKVVLLTGAGSGQGQVASIVFAKAGARVIASDVTEAGLAKTAELAKAEGVDVELSMVDATDEDAVQKWVDQAADRHGGIDVLYNNGAFAHFAPFPDLTLTQWKETLCTELDIVFIPARAVWNHMIARGGGSIINVASVSGMRGVEAFGDFGQTAHGAAKGGVIGFTNQLAAEGARHWIRVNTVSPGAIVTPATAGMIDHDPNFRKLFRGGPLLRRIGAPIDIVMTALFLASDESSYITGVNIPVDGGMSSKVGLSLDFQA